MRFAPLILFIVFSLRAYDFTAPLGVPYPPWGITNTHWMYTNSTYQWDYGSGLTNYRTTANGPYVYYIDKTATNATDTANTYGTPALPRKTWPATIAAGAVVEIHNGPYTFNNLSAKMQLIAVGTTNLPIFFRGVSPNDRAQIGNDLTWVGQYLIIENIDSYKRTLCRLDLYTNTPTHNVCFRNNNFHGLGNESGSGSVIGGFGQFRFSDIATAGGNWASNIVVWNNNISGYGKLSTILTNESDWVGITCGAYSVTNVWWLDNDIHHMGADSMRVGGNSDLSHPPTAHYAYIARNHCHDNGENALDIKMMNDVVVSENIMEGAYQTSHDSGLEVVAHFNPTNIWLLANKIFSCRRGFESSGIVDAYLLGNVFYDVGTQGAQFFGGGDIAFIQNTFARVDTGINNIGGSVPNVPIINCIFYPTTNAQVGYNLSGLAASRMDHNLVYQDGNALNINWGGTTYTSLTTLSNNTTAGDFCLQLDPVFLNAATNNFNINTNSSPAYGTGTNIAYWTSLFESRFGVSIDAYFKVNGTNMIGAYFTEVPPQPPAPEPWIGSHHGKHGKRFSKR